MSRSQDVSRKSCRVLIKEIYKKDHANIRKLLQDGANVNGTDYNGDTPLHHAVASRDLQIVRLLVEHGADVNAENDCGYQPYNIALNDNFVEALEVLLRDDAVITELDRSVSRLPRHIVELFYDKVDLQARNVKGLAALHVVTAIDDVRAARRLLTRGADAGAKSSYTEATPLHLVASREMAELLLEHGAPIDARDRYAVTPLSMIAAKNRKLATRIEQSKIIELFVDRGAEVDDALVTAELQLDFMHGFDEMHGLKDVLKFVALKEHEHGFSERIARDEFSRFYAQALAEVAEMRETEFYCRVSFHEFLVRSWQRRASYIDDVRVAKVGVVDDLDARFPLYGEILRRHVDDARERNEVREKAAMAVAKVCSGLEAVNVVVERVSAFLGRKDMTVLAGAFCGRKGECE